MEEVRRNGGSQFDPELALVMIDMLLEAGVTDEYCPVDFLVTRLMFDRGQKEIIVSHGEDCRFVEDWPEGAREEGQ